MKILVTGGGGFLGQALCRGLVERGHQVLAFNRSHYPELQAMGVGQIRGDLADAQAVLHAVAGVDAVFHNGAKAGAWGSYDSYHQANVVGTDNVIAACRAHGINRLVYTSTPSVTHRATHPVEGLGLTRCRTARTSRHRMRRPRRSPNSACWPPTMYRWRRWHCARA